MAAVQFEPKLGDVNANLARAEVLVREALSKEAHWIVLPEFFPTGTAMHPALFDSYQPLDGRPMQMLKQLATTGKAYMCGSFMARSGADAYNTMVVACPDGELFTHDKDFPTMVFESAFYAAFLHPEIVGNFLCRSRPSEGEFSEESLGDNRRGRSRPLHQVDSDATLTLKSRVSFCRQRCDGFVRPLGIAKGEEAGGRKTELEVTHVWWTARLGSC